MKKSYYLGLMFTFFFARETLADKKIVHMSIGRWGGGSHNVYITKQKDKTFVATTKSCKGKALSIEEQEKTTFGLVGSLEKNVSAIFDNSATFAEKVTLNEPATGTGFELHLAYVENKMKGYGTLHLRKPVIIIKDKVSSVMSDIVEEARKHAKHVCE